MQRFSNYIDDELLHKLDTYWKKNKFKSRNDFMIFLIKSTIEENENYKNNDEIFLKLNITMKQVYNIKHLLEQLFSNYGFPENVNPKEDKLLKEFYDNAKSNRQSFFD